jgi:outer membrane protein assembly factor BamA
MKAGLTLSLIYMARILIIAACLCGSGASLFSQAQNTPTPRPRQQPLFEPVPPAPPLAVGPNVIEGVEFHGARRISQDMLRGVIFSKVGDAYSEEAVRRDVMALRSTDRFDEVRVSTEPGKKGGVVLRFVVTERISER